MSFASKFYTFWGYEWMKKGQCESKTTVNVNVIYLILSCVQGIKFWNKNVFYADNIKNFDV